MKEGEVFWIKVFQDMISWGWSKVAMLATDKFNGIIGVIKKILSTIGSPTWVQFRGEELRKMGKELTKVKASGTKEEGGRLLEKI